MKNREEPKRRSKKRGKSTADWR